MNELWIATGNPKKQRELERLLDGQSYAIRLLRDCPKPVHIVEDKDSFAGNAAAKALPLIEAVTSSELGTTLAIGDDSGLCVDHLDGGPGIHSARYAGPDASDTDCINKLLDALQDLPAERRRAHFTCHICLADATGVLATFEEQCHGTIIDAPRGDDGFGYDPVFVPDEFAAEGLSFAELTAEQKDQISHRGKALRCLVAYLTERRKN